MKLEEFKAAQTAEIMKWAKELDDIITPEKVNPSSIRDYPASIELSERLRKVCKTKADELKKLALQIEDDIMEKVEQEEITLRLDSVGMPVTKRKFPSLEKRKRELRMRLLGNEKYMNLKSEQEAWEQMVADWRIHISKLYREMRILEIDYASNGGGV